MTTKHEAAKVLAVEGNQVRVELPPVKRSGLTLGQFINAIEAAITSPR